MINSCTVFYHINILWKCKAFYIFSSLSTTQLRTLFHRFLCMLSDHLFGGKIGDTGSKIHNLILIPKPVLPICIPTNSVEECSLPSLNIFSCLYWLFIFLYESTLFISRKFGGRFIKDNKLWVFLRYNFF